MRFASGGSGTVRNIHGRCGVYAKRIAPPFPALPRRAFPLNSRLWGLVVGPSTARTLVVNNSGGATALHVRLTLRFGHLDFSHVLSTTTFSMVAPWTAVHAALDVAALSVPTLELTVDWIDVDGNAQQSVRMLQPFTG